MCVLAFAWHAHPQWRLVAAGNRDEMHERPAAAAARWNTPDHVLGGRDLQSGGAWLGVSEQGRFAVVTNLRGYGAPEPGQESRGALVLDVLAGEGRYSDPSPSQTVDFNPFNLIVASGEQALFLSNRPDPVRTPLEHGIYGLSNGSLDEPWPKTLRLKGRLLDWILADSPGPDMLLEGLRDEALPEAGLLPAAASDVPQEPELSPIFIRNPVYGTRCSTVVAIDHKGVGLMVERRYSPDGDPVGETTLSFSWPD